MLFFLATKTIFTADADGELIAQDLPIPEVPHPDYGMAMTKMFLSLTFLIVLGFVTFWFLKRIFQERRERGRGTEVIRILEKRMISPKSMLYLVEVEGKKVLLAESQLEVRRLQTWTDLPEEHS